MRTWPYQRLTSRLEAASALPGGDLQGEGGIGGSEATDAAQVLGTSSAEDNPAVPDDTTVKRTVGHSRN
jgi:hypothetical protein